MARRKQQQVERARQTTAAWQPASVSIGLQVHLIWATFEGGKHPRIEKVDTIMDVFHAAALVNGVNLFRELQKV